MWEGLLVRTKKRRAKQSCTLHRDYTTDLNLLVGTLGLIRLDEHWSAVETWTSDEFGVWSRAKSKVDGEGRVPVLSDLQGSAGGAPMCTEVQRGKLRCDRFPCIRWRGISRESWAENSCATCTVRDVPVAATTMSPPRFTTTDRPTIAASADADAMVQELNKMVER
jgi:hypothetical protein